jgi:uncharacterized protein (UPF0276 family)
MKYGLGWRTELGAAIFANLDRIDVVEVMAEDFFAATKEQKRALRFLRDHVTVVLHATSLGLASTEAVDRSKLDAIARVAGWLEPTLWSEHLAFVRGGGVEVGHLAAPPRNDATLAGLVRNIEIATRVTGTKPLLENVASLIEPPLCRYDEGAWLRAVVDATDCDLLLDLHNVHANGVNFGFDASEVVRSFPMERVRAVHLAGGKRIERNRLLDDHKHAVPDDVFALLAYVCNENAMIVLERDGAYPPFDELLDELERARNVVRSGGIDWRPADGGWQFGRREWDRSPVELRPDEPGVASLPRADVIARLARIYVDREERERFLAHPDLALDRDDLLLAVRSFERKRQACVPSMKSTNSEPNAIDGVSAPLSSERSTRSTAASADSIVK